jgi:hypothetical protein
MNEVCRVTSDLLNREIAAEAAEIEYQETISRLEDSADYFVNTAPIVDWESLNIMEWLMCDDILLLDTIRNVCQNKEGSVDALKKLVRKAAIQSLADKHDIIWEE